MISKILIVNNAERNVRDFVLPICDILDENDYDYDQIEYKKLPNVDVNGYMGVILSGSPMGDNIVFSHQRYYSWLDECIKPVFGICASHQILGVYYGADLIRGKESENGNAVPVRIEHKDEPLFNGMGDEILTMQTHNDSVACPENCTVLARSQRCGNQIMKLNGKPVYTAQFHAEHSNPDMILNFLQLCNV